MPGTRTIHPDPQIDPSAPQMTRPHYHPEDPDMFDTTDHHLRGMDLTPDMTPHRTILLADTDPDCDGWTTHFYRVAVPASVHGERAHTLACRIIGRPSDETWTIEPGEIPEYVFEYLRWFDHGHYEHASVKGTPLDQHPVYPDWAEDFQTGRSWEALMFHLRGGSLKRLAPVSGGPFHGPTL